MAQAPYERNDIFPRMMVSILVVVMAQDWLGPKGPEVFHKATPIPKVAESSSSQQEPTKILGFSLPATPSLSLPKLNLPKLRRQVPPPGQPLGSKEFKWSITSSIFRQVDDSNLNQDCFSLKKTRHVL